MALGSLGARYITSLSIPDLVYRAVEAKFVAETAQGVGKKGTIIVMWRKGLEHTTFLPEANPLRVAYDRTARDAAPEDAQDFITASFSSLLDRRLQ